MIGVPVEFDEFDGDIEEPLLELRMSFLSEADDELGSESVLVNLECRSEPVLPEKVNDASDGCVEDPLLVVLESGWVTFSQPATVNRNISKMQMICLNDCLFKFFSRL